LSEFIKNCWFQFLNISESQNWHSGFLIFQNQRTVNPGFLEKEIRIKELPTSVISKTSKN